MNPKAVIFDLDSTLSLSKQPLTDAMGQALKALLEHVPVAVMSGADFAQFERQLLPHLPKESKFENLYLFPTSAAECLVYVNGQWESIYSLKFTVEEKTNIMRVLEETVKESGLVADAPQFGDRIENRGEQITFSALGQEAPLELKEKWDPHQEKRTILRATLLERLPECEISIGGTTSIDILRKGIDKSYGLRWLSEHLQVNIQEMLYVGDALFEGGNDAAAIKTGVALQAVSGPDETLKVIETIVANKT